MPLMLATSNYEHQKNTKVVFGLPFLLLLFSLEGE
jgi:hypothetical protein